MSEPRQKQCKILGETGCYALCIVYLAEEILGHRVDVLEIYEIAVYAGIMEPDCFVNKPEKLLQLMVPGKWEVEKVEMNYETAPEELEIIRYERQTVGGLLNHFVVGNGQGEVRYDPLGDSLCVKYGRPVSKRIFRQIT